jgi:predicted Ser/Thr protein kinase
MSTEDSLSRKEDKLKSQGCCSKEDIKEYCDVFYEEHKDFTFRPFILNDVGQTLSRKPFWYDEYQKNLAEHFLKPDDDYARDDSVEAGKPGEEINQDALDEIVNSLRPSGD